MSTKFQAFSSLLALLLLANHCHHHHCPGRATSLPLSESLEAYLSTRVFSCVPMVQQPCSIGKELAGAPLQPQNKQASPQAYRSYSRRLGFLRLRHL